jgi:hypothetical protein
MEWADFKQHCLAMNKDYKQRTAFSPGMSGPGGNDLSTDSLTPGKHLDTINVKPLYKTSFVR